MRFRQKLVAEGIEARLFAAVVRRLEAQKLVARTGTLVDVEPLERHWSERQWQGVIGQAAPNGGIVRRVAVTPASVYDSQAGRDRVRARRGQPRIARRLRKGMAPAKAAARLRATRAAA